MKPVFTHGTLSVAKNAPLSFLLPCLNGARLLSANLYQAIFLPSEDDIASVAALSPCCTSAFVAGRSGFAVLACLEGDSPPTIRNERTFRPFDNGVAVHAVYDSTGSLLAIAEATGSVHVYDREAFHTTHAFTLPRDILTTALQFHPNPDKLLLYVGMEDGSVYCFDLAQRSKKPTFLAKHHVSAVTSLTFANKNDFLVASGKDGVISVSQAHNGKKVRLIVTREDIVGITPYAPRPNTVISAGNSGVLRVWDVFTGSDLTPLSVPVPFTHRVTGEAGGNGEGQAEAMISSMTGFGEKGVVVTLSDQTIIAFEADAKHRLFVVKALCGNLEQVNDLRAIPCRNSSLDSDVSSLRPSFLVASNSPLLWVVQPPCLARRSKASVEGGSGPLGSTSPQYAVDENLRHVGSEETQRSQGWTCVGALGGHRGIVLSLDVVAFPENKKKRLAGPDCMNEIYAASGSRDKTARVWHRNPRGRWSCVGIAEGHTDAVTAVALSPKNAGSAFLVTTANDRTLKFWSLESIPKQASRDVNQVGADREVAKSVLANVLHEDKDAVQLTAAWTVLAHEKDINAVACSPDGRCLATGSQDRTLKLWEAGSGSLQFSCRGHRRGVFDVAFSPVDKIVASASGDSTIRVWNARNGSCLRTLQGHSGSVLRSLFITRGVQLVSSGMDGLMKVWSVRSGECGVTIDAHKDSIWALDVVGDGDAVISGGMDGVVELWSDATQVRAEKAAERKRTEIALTQRIGDATRARKWATAADALLCLNMPRKLKAVFVQVITTTKEADDELAALVRAVGVDSEACSSVGGSTASEKLGRLLGYCRDWGTVGGPSCASLAVHVLRAVFRLWSPDKLCEIVSADRRSLVEALAAHTARHQSRVSDLAARARFLDFTLEAMRGLPDQSQLHASRLPSGSKKRALAEGVTGASAPPQSKWAKRCRDRNAGSY